MSRFFSETFPCPNCKKPMGFGIVASVNADRRPDFREAILQGTFQRGTCTQCAKPFRIEPELTYFDGGRRQWILVEPAARLGDWPALEQNARSTFDRTYGPEAAKSVQKLGKTLQARVTFGWAALREKLLCAQHGLDDVTLELVKIALIRSLDDVPLGSQNELRLTDLQRDELKLSWIIAAAELPIENLSVPRALYDEIAADQTGWSELRAQISSGPFVDVHRLLVGEAGATPAPAESPPPEDARSASESPKAKKPRAGAPAKIASGRKSSSASKKKK
jgi:hypothetical protein